MVEETIDLDEMVHSHNIRLLSTFSDDLATHRETLTETLAQMDDEHRKVGEDLGVDIDKKLHLENHQVYHYSFRITKAVSNKSYSLPGLTKEIVGSRVDPQ